MRRAGRTTERTTTARAARRAAALAVVPVFLAACVADPPPPRGEGQQGPAQVAISPNALSVVVDTLDAGFNPHLRSDLGPDTDLLSALTLPSAYTRTESGELRRNADLVDSVTVASEQPFTLRYELNRAAQWSDGVPIGAEDFRYLWRNASTFPGSVDSAAYRHVTGVTSGAGGKTVDVTFDAFYPEWRTLFSNLLPAHLMGNSARSFADTLAQGATASGGPFTIDSVDLGIGQIVLARNDRYWATPPQAEQIVLRLAPDRGTLGQAARSGAATLVSVADSPLNHLVLDTVGGYEGASAFDGDQVSLTWNTTAAATDDRRVRAALSSFVDTRAVAQIVAGQDTVHVADFPLTSEIAVPSGADTATGEKLLREAGYTKSDGTWTKDGVALDITLGVVAGDESTLVAASTITDSLRSQGVRARVWELSDDDLYGGALPYGLVSGAVTWSPAAGDPLAAAENRYRCVAEDGGATASQAQADQDTVFGEGGEARAPQPAPASVTRLEPPTAAETTAPGAPAQAGAEGTAAEQAQADAEEAEKSAEKNADGAITVPLPTAANGEPILRFSRSDNLSGLCDPDVDAAIDDALATASAAGSARPGADDVAADPAPIPAHDTYSRRVADAVDALSVELPLSLDSRLLAHSPTFAGLALPGGDEAGRPAGRELYDSAFEWRTS